MTTPSDDEAGPVPVRVVLPADPVLGHPEQEVVARLWRRRQTETGWLYLVGLLPSFRDREDGGVEAADRVWVRAPDHVRPVDGVDYDQVVTEKLERAPQAVVREVLGERRPSGWVLAKVREGRGPARSVLHAPDYEETPAGAPLLDVDRALDAAEHPGTRLCTLCGAAQELTPLLRGFDHITDSAPDDS
ncbi:hypothetical protein QFZ49_005070 [Streptomyces turgidiscabies]|uniref:Uncharacterized protein n=1 Tax=Streptomyces turgidiscabies TaxID=85558 RepID=A0ABU0RT16_9ACTN|nr:hypothetical protein [Streptomyces turgidiscabies]